jgi:hypothetical protein
VGSSNMENDRCHPFLHGFVPLFLFSLVYYMHYPDDSYIEGYLYPSH